MDENRKGVLLYLAAVWLMAVMDAAAKWLTRDYPVGQLVLFRSLFAFLPIGLLYVKNSNDRGLKTDRLGMHVIRGMLVVLTVATFFFSLRYLPLADTTAISLSGPLFMTAFGALILREKTMRRHWIAVCVGFVGVLFIVQPGTGVFQAVSLVALLSAIFYALAAIATRFLTSTESPLTITIYSNGVMTAAAAVSLVFGWVTPSMFDLGVLAVLGIAGGLSNYIFSMAFKYAKVSLLAPLDYTILVWATVFGFAIWRDIPTLPVIFGALIVVAGGIAISLTAEEKMPQEIETEPLTTRCSEKAP